MTAPQRFTGHQLCLSCVVLRHFHQSLSDNSCQNKPRRLFGGRGVGTQKPQCSTTIKCVLEFSCSAGQSLALLNWAWCKHNLSLTLKGAHRQTLLCEPASENWSAVQVHGTVGNTGSVIMSNHREDASGPVQNMFFSFLFFLFLFYWNLVGKYPKCHVGHMFACSSNYSSLSYNSKC